jgi:hypothetical protein
VLDKVEDQLLAGLGRRNASSRARQEADANAFLEPADRMTERGLRHTQPFGRPRKAAFFRYGEESRQDIEFIAVHS